MAEAARDMVVIDGDGHVMEPDDLWLRRMDRRKWGDWIPYQHTLDGLYIERWVGGQLRAGGRELTDQLCARLGLTPAHFHEMYQQMHVPGGEDPDARIADMERDGIDAAVLYPSAALFFGPVDLIEALHNLDFVLDCQRAYNEWISEYCRAHPKRLFGLGVVPLQDPERAIPEAERAVKQLGLVGVCIRPSAYVDELPLSHRVYDRFWAACQDLDVPVAFHPGVHVDTPGACRKFGLVLESSNATLTNTAQDEVHGGSGLGQAVGNAVDMMVTLGRVLMGGICERFPRLRFLCLESGGGWIPTLVQRLDEQVRAFPREAPWLKLLPSEYFRRQCYAGFEAEEWNLAASARFLGTDRILWASDYPHPEYHPGILRELRESLEGLSAPEQRQILGTNAITAYRLPPDAGARS